MQYKLEKVLRRTAQNAENSKIIDITPKTQYNHDKFLNALCVRKGLVCA